MENLLAERGILVSYEAVRDRCPKFGSATAGYPRRKQGRFGEIRHDDELFVAIQGEQLSPPESSLSSAAPRRSSWRLERGNLCLPKRKNLRKLSVLESLDLAKLDNIPCQEESGPSPAPGAHVPSATCLRKASLGFSRAAESRRSGPPGGELYGRQLH